MRIRIDFQQSTLQTAYPFILKEQLSVLASRFAGISIGVSGFGPGFYSSGLSGSQANFRLKVLGYHFEEVRRIAEDLGKKLERNRRVTEINTSGSGRWSWGQQTETLLAIRRERLPKYGLSVSDVIGQVLSYLRENQQWQRLRPILMTTATTVFGLLPLVVSGGDSRLWGTLALATIGGLASSALLVTPALYRIFVRETSEI